MLISSGPMAVDDLANWIAFLCLQSCKKAFHLMAADGIVV